MKIKSDAKKTYMKAYQLLHAVVDSVAICQNAY